jgi:hypothetical protein
MEGGQWKKRKNKITRIRKIAYTGRGFKANGKVRRIFGGRRDDSIGVAQKGASILMIFERWLYKNGVLILIGAITFSKPSI